MKMKQTWNKTRWVVMLAFITNGVLMATWISRIPAVQIKLGLNDSELGLVLVGFSAGLLTALFLTGGLIARYGSPKVTLVSTLASCLALPFLMVVSSPVLVFALLFVFGGGISAADVAMNEQAVLVERNAGRPLMSSFHGGYSVGGFAGALIGAGMAALPGLPPLVHFLSIAILIFGVILFVTPRLIPTERESGENAAMFRLPERAVWLLGAIAFCSSIGEETVGDWGAVYLTQVLKTDAAFAALGYAAFSLTMTTMRLIGDFLSKRWTPAVIIRAGAFIAAMGILEAALTKNPIVVVAGLA
ncbi:MAG: MFS transporter, partial [Anaerolineae bacterium]|nr:MFS transporter [Anaerolineae bacterium]